ncbi:gliding motility-associated C-terminal domain-containing protein [Lacibacter luteus]|nr:gliding motility-associated C-terminal domain-containing protein [Lacibacter luteus]
MKSPVKSILLIFAVQLFLVNYSISQVNSRTRYTFQSPANIQLENGSSVFKQFLLQDNSTLLLLKIIGRNNTGKLTEVISLQKLDSQGNVLWQKKIEGTLTDHEASIENAILLSDESILLAGSFTNKIPSSNKTNRSKILILKISSDGITVWDKSYSLNTNPDQPNLLSGYALLEMADKSFILTATRFINDPASPISTFRLSLKFDSNGNQLWENQYRLLNIDEQGHMNPGIAEVDNNLLIYNNVSSTCTNENDPDCFNYESFAAIITLNSKTGVITSSKKINYADVPPPESLFGTKNDDHSFNTHQVYYNDTTIKLFNYLRRFTSDGNKCRIGFLLTLNKSLEVINASEVRVNNVAINPNANNYMYVSLTNNFSTDGSLQIGFSAAKAKSFLGEIIEEDSLRYYFTKINASHQLQWQKKASVFAPGSQVASAPSIFETKTCLTQIALGYVKRTEQTAGKFNVDLLRFNPMLRYNNNCFTTDTSFVEITEAPVGETDLYYNELLNSNLFLPLSASVTLAATALPDREIICGITSDCSSTKIIATDTACTNTDLFLSVKKNVNCYDPLIWIVPKQVANTVFVTDSSLQLNFQQPWKGNIYLSKPGCDSTLLDSFFLTVIEKPMQLELGNDTMLCSNLPIPIRAGSKFKSYYWNTGATDSIINVTLPGTYKVQVVDYCNNLSQDSVTVFPQDFALTINPVNTIICKGDSLLLSASPGFYDYIWTPSPFLSNSFARETVSFPPTTTTYSVRAKKFTGCELEQLITVKVDECAETVFIPNSFTPNNDGLNDEFKPIIKGNVLAYEFLIYNRFGEIVFNSTQKNKAWDGAFKNKQQPPGLYTWIIRYHFKNKKPVTKNGTITLIR